MDFVSCKISLLVHLETTREPQNLLMRAAKQDLGSPDLKQAMLKSC